MLDRFVSLRIDEDQKLNKEWNCGFETECSLRVSINTDTENLYLPGKFFTS